jgi:hypothetical protein
MNNWLGIEDLNLRPPGPEPLFLSRLRDDMRSAGYAEASDGRNTNTEGQIQPDAAVAAAEDLTVFSISSSVSLSFL